MTETITMSLRLARFVTFEKLLESEPDEALGIEAENFMLAVAADIEREAKALERYHATRKGGNVRPLK